MIKKVNEYEFFNLRESRLLDLEQEFFHYTVEDLSEQLSYGKCILISTRMSLYLTKSTAWGYGP